MGLMPLRYMIKHGNKTFYVLVTDNGYYLQKSDPTKLVKDLHRATMYDNMTVARRCLTTADDRFHWCNSYGYGYHAAKARKLGVRKISIAEITIHSYDEIII